MNKPRAIKDYAKLSDDMQEQIKLFYPNGFSDHLIRFTDKDGKNVSALPYETEDKYYLIRMTNLQAQKIIKDDTDYDDDGNLKDDIKDDYEDKYTDLDTMRVGSGRKSDEDEDYD
ncbi:hypothetical protein [Lacihabitans soyangensis]|jgi:hypothetical protein|uniref:Uncharacterized protein n=1 Tax=Lacihabitans soyangensis TaxID=869394 RepID=A0AAE3H5E1_9BACT|nr:hypothetical protein [Lacihabitans soyangensis]MCP9765242.1 hypothetical protein [Lacihabitans soyangensis]